MRIVCLKIERFRAIRSATLFPGRHNVYLGPNNIGKTAILEALNLLLNPEIAYRAGVVDENDFYRREYRIREPAAPSPRGEEEEDPRKSQASAEDVAGENSGAQADIPGETPGTAPTMEAAGPATATAHASEQGPATEAPILRIEAVITDLSESDMAEFSQVLVPWDPDRREVVERTDEGVDPFANATAAVRPCFEAWYDEDEDAFAWKSFFRTDPQLSRDESPSFTRQHKREIGFLIYRDFRALQRPITLEPYTLFGRILQSQDATPREFETVLEELRGSILPLFREPDFARVVNEYRQELLRYLPLANIGEGRLTFEATDRTREEVKAAAQLYVDDEIALPLQKMGAGTRSLAILAMLLFIARKRGRGIIALEEPETFLFPHAQRRVIDEVMALASQTFVTTHSPYVLERLPVESFHRLVRDDKATVSATALVADTVTARQIRDRFRKQLSEALLGRGAIVVEEESTRLWVLRTSALLHGREFDGARMEALELQGISVVTAAGNGDVPSVAGLLRRAGLQVVGFLDQVSDAELQQYMTREPDLPLLFHSEKGLEDLMLRYLPKELVRGILIDAPYAKHNYDPAEVDGWESDEFERNAREFLRRHKGYQPFHEGILDRVDLATMPALFKRLVATAVAHSRTREVLAPRSLLPR